ncbi:MAG: hypothetical protein S4CHLAM45_00940 [Chlamydiales bacterium]|nr:hypothetical protein [Chlamydiales bacterium]MCH9619415.1 hypothetical protein [Chlamydiales bacterium]MCH9622219.1 hypothetical protein [Chlamydiales bacterium]
MYYSGTKNLSKKSNLYFEAEQRWRKHASEMHLYYFGIYYGYYFSNCFEVRPGYRQWWRIVRGKWEPLYTPLLDGIYSNSYGKWKFRNRSRGEILIFGEDRKSEWRFRNLTEIKLPIALGKMELTPYIFDEVFFRETVGFVQNRISGGGEFKITDKLTGRIGYIYRTLKGARQWNVDNVLATYFKYKF